MYPKAIRSAKAPLIKSQGIKTKLVPFILSQIRWDGRGRWIEPFVGSGAVLFNATPERALAADSNEHLIRLYQAVQQGQVTPHIVEAHLKREGAALRERGEDHYYEVRARFNADHSPLDLIFLNRSCFNGVMRFNKRGGFNVPFCRKVDRFRTALVTKICNQVAWIARQMKGRDWTFITADWRATLDSVTTGDFVYLDPPYVGRHTDYYNNWSDQAADALAARVKELPAGFAYSMWKENKYRANLHLATHFAGYHTATFEHFYHVGSSEDLRNAMEEALVISPGCVADQPVLEHATDEFRLGL